MNATETGPGPLDKRLIALVRGLNSAWIEGSVDDLGQFFHEDAIMQLPGLQGRVEGKNAIVETYRDFLRQARLHSFDELGIVVDLLGVSAVVTTDFEVEYSLGTERYQEKGTEFLVLTGGSRDSGDWRIAWRSMVISK